MVRSVAVRVPFSMCTCSLRVSPPGPFAVRILTSKRRDCAHEHISTSFHIISTVPVTCAVTSPVVPAVPVAYNSAGPRAGSQARSAGFLTSWAKS